MNETIKARQERPLLNYAISRLKPGVFSHPVWIRFSKKEKPIVPEALQRLLEESERIQLDNPRDACQVLLVCAVHQNYSGQRSSALTTLKKALDLAESTGLTQESLWVIWGACAVSVQQGNFEQADMHFRHLQSVLYEQNEWVLADYIEIVRQNVHDSGTIHSEYAFGSTPHPELGPLLTCTVDWLHQWGYFAPPESESSSKSSISILASQGTMDQSCNLNQSEQGPWQTLKLIFQGEFKLRLVRSSSSSMNQRRSFWETLVSSLKLRFSGQKAGFKTIDIVPESPEPFSQQEEVHDFVSILPFSKQNIDEESSQTPPNPPVGQTIKEISVSVHMLGKFELSIRDETCKLSASRSLSLLKYLLLHHQQSIAREVLMDVFWPEAAPETARNSLNVSMHNIRRALHPILSHPAILYKDGTYRIAPDLQIWLDVEEFERLVNIGKRLETRNQSAAVSEYEAATSIYQGDFLEENPYEEWTILIRERLRAAYLDTLDRLSQIYFSQGHYAACITNCQKILARDSCREDAHCMLMRCYNRQGHDHMALRQYQACVEALRMELDVPPAPETVQLFQHIRQHRRV